MFLHISTDFVTECEKFLFQLKALQKRVQKDENRFIVHLLYGSGDKHEKRKVEKQGDVFFCYRL